MGLSGNKAMHSDLNRPESHDLTQPPATKPRPLYHPIHSQGLVEDKLRQTIVSETPAAALAFRSGMGNLALEERWAVLSPISSQLLLGSGFPGTLTSHSSPPPPAIGYTAAWCCIVGVSCHVLP